MRLYTGITCLLFAAFAAAPARTQTVADPLLHVTVYACCPELPTSLAFLPGTSGSAVDMLVLEKVSGRVQHFRDGVLQGTALDLPVASYGERGLLGIALHPNFAVNHHVYLYYTTSPTALDAVTPSEVRDNRIERYTWNGSTLVSPQLVLPLPARPAFFHIGGVITFGTDGMLYGIIGDVGHSGQLQNNPLGPTPDTTSCIYRIRDDGTPPADNPFYAMGGAMQFVYGYGIRNSFGIEFDPRTDTLWQTENGPNLYDEINRFPRGFNSGWAQIMGPVARDPEGTSTLWVAPGSQYVDPEFSWLDTNAPAAIHFLQSDSLGAQYRDDIFVGSYNDHAIFHFELDAGRTHLVMPDTSVADRVADNAAQSGLFVWASGFGGGIVDLETGPDGALYASSLDNGTIYRIGRSPTSDVPASRWATGRLEVHPNPFRTTATLRVIGATDPTGVLRIYTATGRLVRVLESRGTLAWDGTDANGRPAAAGMYVARLEGGTGFVALQAKITRLP